MIGGRQILWLVLAVISVAMVNAKGKECGDNPMKQVLLVAKRTGRSLQHVLTVLQDIDAPAYETLARRFRMYAACVGLVDTGYFRKRSQPPTDAQEMLPELSYRAMPGSEQNINKRLSDLTTGPLDLADLGEDYLQYKRDSLPMETALTARDVSHQLLDDADDMSRTILALYTKAKQIIDAERRRNQMTSYPSEFKSPLGLSDSYANEEFPYGK